MAVIHVGNTSTVFIHNDWLCPDEILMKTILSLSQGKKCTIMLDTQYQAGNWYKITFGSSRDSKVGLEALRKSLNIWTRRDHLVLSNFCIMTLDNILFFGTMEDRLQAKLRELENISGVFHESLKMLRTLSTVNLGDPNAYFYIYPGSERTLLRQITPHMLICDSYVAVLRKTYDLSDPAVYCFYEIVQQFECKGADGFNNEYKLTAISQEQYQKYKELFDRLSQAQRQYLSMIGDINFATLVPHQRMKLQKLCEEIEYEITFETESALLPLHLDTLQRLLTTASDQECDEIYKRWLSAIPTMKIIDLSESQIDKIYDFFITRIWHRVLPISMEKVVLDLSCNLKKLLELRHTLPELTTLHACRDILGYISIHHAKILQQFGLRQIARGFSDFPTMQLINQKLEYLISDIVQPDIEPFVTDDFVVLKQQHDFWKDFARGKTTFIDSLGNSFRGSAYDLSLHDALVVASCGHLKVRYKLQALIAQPMVPILIMNTMNSSKYYLNSKEIVLWPDGTSEKAVLRQLDDTSFTFTMNMTYYFVQSNQHPDDPIALLDDCCRPVCVYGTGYVTCFCQFRILGEDLICIADPVISLGMS